MRTVRAVVKNLENDDLVSVTKVLNRNGLNPALIEIVEFQYELCTHITIQMEAVVELSFNNEKELMLFKLSDNTIDIELK